MFKESNMTSSFRDTVFLSQTHRSLINQILGAESDLDDLLESVWVEQNGEAKAQEESSFTLYLDESPNGEVCKIGLVIGANKFEGENYPPLAVTYVNENTGDVVVPAKALENFAWLGPWSELLDTLANLSQEEIWDFPSRNEYHHSYEILHNYLNYTFYRLKRQGKICISSDQAFAAFNTGLVDDRFDDIFACFEPSEGKSEWKFVDFAPKGNRPLKKKLDRYFNPLPQRATYFAKLEDVVFDAEKTIENDFEHIFLDNLSRFPFEFLCRLVRSYDSNLESIFRLGKEEAEAIQDLTDLLDEDPHLYMHFRDSFDNAVNRAKLRTRANYKLAVPSYYPRKDSMSFLLPVSLLDEESADIVLVVQLLDSGIYQGQTILDKETAYCNARLICKPESEWLRI